MSRCVRTAIIGSLVLASPATAVAVAPVAIASNTNDAWAFTDRKGVTHVAWSVSSGSQSQTLYTRALPGATRFEAPRQLDVPKTGEDFPGPFIVQEPAPSNRVVIVVQRCCVTPTTLALVSSDSGASWSTAQGVADPDATYNPSDGRVPLVAARNGGLVVFHGNPSATFFSVPTSFAPITPNSGLVALSPAPLDGQVTIDAAGTPVFGYADFTGKSYVRVGETGAEQLVDASNRSVPGLVMSGGPRGVGVLAKTGGATSTSEALTFRLLSGTSLGAPIRLSAPNTDQGVPFLIADQSGRFHAVWRTPGENVIYRQSETGAAWTSPTTLVKNSDVAGLVVAAGANGSGWAVWHDAISNSRLLATPLTTVSTNPAVPDTTDIENPVVTRRGARIFVTPRNPSREALRKRKCVNVRVQSTKPARINVAIFSGRKSTRLFGQKVIRFTKPGKKTVCVKVPLNAKTFNVRQPFRFAFAVKDGATARRGEGPGKLTLTGFTFFR